MQRYSSTGRNSPPIGACFHGRANYARRCLRSCRSNGMCLQPKTTAGVNIVYLVKQQRAALNVLARVWHSIQTRTQLAYDESCALLLPARNVHVILGCAPMSRRLGGSTCLRAVARQGWQFPRCRTLLLRGFEDEIIRQRDTLSYPSGHQLATVLDGAECCPALGISRRRAPAPDQ
jgi:hypothetical protein